MTVKDLVPDSTDVNGTRVVPVAEEEVETEVGVVVIVVEGEVEITVKMEGTDTVS